MANNIIDTSDQKSKEGDAKTQFDVICNDLDLNESIKTKAWDEFEQINRNVTLEGDSLHWLACSLYVSCRKACLVKDPSTDAPSIPLAKLLNLSQLSMLHFFQKVYKWLDMGKHGNELSAKVEQLERNFSVSSIVFEKYLSIFDDIYIKNWTESTKRGRSQKGLTALTTRDIFNFCWTLYIRTKANYPEISDDLVNSYHLLLCCVDIIFANILSSKQFKSSLNPYFKGVPKDFMDFEYNDVPSIIDDLCQLYEGLAIETKIICKQFLGAFLDNLIKNHHMRGQGTNKKTNLMSQQNLKFNLKYLNDSYEKLILQNGDIDERIFIKEDAPIRIGTPVKRVTAFTDVDERERSSESFITQPAIRLQELVKGLKPAPSDELYEIFKTFKENPEENLKTILNNFSSIFIEEYSKKFDDSSNIANNTDFAKARLHLSLVLFYKTLEIFLKAEKKKSSADLSVLLQQEIFIKCLFTCCLEIVIYSYNSSKVFPWILKVFNLKPYHFFKVIELVIRGEDLSRDVIKHLSRIEEQILETLSWRTGSPIYSALKTYGIPRCQEVATDTGVMTPLFFMSPTTVRMNKDGVQQSPIISLRDRFGPVAPPGPAKRNLFGSPVKTEPAKTADKQATAVVLPPNTAAGQLSSVRFPIMLASPGSSPVRLFTVATQRGTPPRTGVIRIPASPSKANTKKYGSLGIFFRKLYHMSSLRLKDLCDNLSIGSELHKKIWTCFEHSLVENIDILRDRHIDQLLMCAVYVMAKVTKEDKSFHEIMKWYRTQPQATSDVYRHVLIERASDRVSSETDTEASSTANSAVDKVEENIKKEENENNKEEERIKTDQDNANDDQMDKNVYNDLIQFYNIVYIKKIKDFALKFASNKVTLDAPPLSPLPVSRKQVHSPRQVSKQHQIYLSPIKSAVQMTPRSKMLYCFDSDSPNKLGEINAMIKGGTRRRVLLDADEETGPTAPKRPLNGLVKRAQELRQEQMNHRPLNNHK
ncbi:retinoblastoma-like protein 1 isoform X2 [Hydractinia symbiolongicarpus]|uniref:retinoblastoma-like protein 1 isoform X2 n=1 Tax=Hydractinia symbiolongicarpus TaxID=13093 RepID=UPI00254BB14D|nr:retinoblastoma-like protein 1 isoform X2 [Hydractinia symbiolongicarpus]